MGIIIMFKFVATLAATAVSVEEEMPINETMIQEAIAADELKFFGDDEMAEIEDDDNLLEVGEMTDAEFWSWAKKQAARARAAAARAAALARRGAAIVRTGRTLYAIGRRLYSGNTRQRKAAARQLIRLVRSTPTPSRPSGSTDSEVTSTWPT